MGKIGSPPSDPPTDRRLKYMENALQLLHWIEEPLRSQLQNQAEVVLALFRAREDKGLNYWDTRSALYAQNLVRSKCAIFCGIEEYAIRAKKHAAGDKRFKQEQLDLVKERFLLPAIEIDLDQPHFCPIDPSSFPGSIDDAVLNEYGRKITNSHTDQGMKVWLVWDYPHAEPSFWHCIHEGASGLSEISPAEAVTAASSMLDEWEKDRNEKRNKNYSAQELTCMNGYTLRSIVRARGLAMPKSKRLGDLRRVIAQPQLPLMEKK